MSGEFPPDQGIEKRPWDGEPWKSFAVAPGTSVDEARAVLRKAALRFHPDVTHSWPKPEREAAEAVMKELSQAVESAENGWPPVAPETAPAPASSYRGVFATVFGTPHTRPVAEKPASPKPYWAQVVRLEGVTLGKSTADGSPRYYVIDSETLQRKSSVSFSKIDRISGTSFLVGANTGPEETIMNLDGEVLLSRVTSRRVDADGIMQATLSGGEQVRLSPDGKRL